MREGPAVISPLLYPALASLFFQAWTFMIGTFRPYYCHLRADPLEVIFKCSSTALTEHILLACIGLRVLEPGLPTLRHYRWNRCRAHHTHAFHGRPKIVDAIVLTTGNVLINWATKSPHPPLLWHPDWSIVSYWVIVGRWQEKGFLVYI